MVVGGFDDLEPGGYLADLHSLGDLVAALVELFLEGAHLTACPMPPI